MAGKEKKEPTSKKQVILRIIAIVLLLGGIVLVINGAITMSIGDSMFGDPDAPWFETVSRGSSLLAGGFFMIIPAIFLLAVSFTMSFAGRIMETASNTFNHDSEYERYEKIIEESSKRHPTKAKLTEGTAFIGDMDSARAIKIKCQLCGALNDEDAAFCDQCSQPL